jgi:NADH kinase
MSPFPIPCVNRASSSAQPHGRGAGQEAERDDEPRLIEGNRAIGANPDRGEDDWVKDINTLLRFNASFAGRGLLGSAEEEDHRDPDRRGGGTR